MASRQSNVSTSVSQNGLQYAAPNAFAVAQNDISLSNQTSNPSLGGIVTGTGSNTVAKQTIPILTSSGANHGLTSSGTTATCNLASPHGYAVGASGVTATIQTGNGSYNVTAASITITSPYSFTYTTVGSNLPVSDGGIAIIPVPAWTATQSTTTVLPAATAVGTTGQPFSAPIPGSTINGLVVGTLEYWGDSTLWDTTNNRVIVDNFSIDSAIQFKSS